MNTIHNQRGASLPGLLLLAAMVGFFMMCIIKMAPPYFESLSVKAIIESVVTDPEVENYSTTQIRRKIETEFNTNQILELQAKEVEVYRKKGQTFIDSSYEVRLPMVWRVDAVLKFNDLHYALGSLEPVAGKASE